MRSGTIRCIGLAAAFVIASVGGALADRSVVLLAPLPSFDAIAIPAGTVSDQRITLPLVAHNLKPASSVAILSVTPAAGCGFKVNGGATLPSAVADATGKAALSLTGAFVNTTSSPTGPCSLTMRFRSTDGLGTTAERDITFPNLTLSAPVTYTLEATNDWVTKFGFTSTNAFGSCSGISILHGIADATARYLFGLPGLGGYGVGQRETSDGDVVFFIRSGPLGTDCSWKSKPIALPSGVKLKVMLLELSTDDTCKPTIQAQTKSGSNAHMTMTSADVTTQSTSDPARDQDGTSAGTNPNGAGLPVTILGPLRVQLKCGITALDNKLTFLAIKSIVFTGPPGLTFP